MHITITDVIAEDDRVAGRFTFSGTHRGEFNGIPPTNRSFSVEGVDIYRFEGGKIAEAWSSFDSLGMLQQLGVIPTPESSHA
jgi:predicted ester cyclase